MQQLANIETSGVRPARISSLRFLIFIFGLCLLSTFVDGLPRLVPISELGGDLWMYFAAVFILATMVQAVTLNRFRATTTRYLLRQQFAVLCVFSAFTLVNVVEITQSHVNGIDGVSKLASNLAVYGFYLLFAACLAFLVDQIEAMHALRVISGQCYVIGWIVLVLSLFEIASWFYPSLRGIYISLRSLYSVRPNGDFLRLNGLNYEPSYFSSAQLAIAPWIMMYRSFNRSRMATVLIVLLAILGVVGGSRTHILGIVILGGFYLLFISGRRIRTALVTMATACMLILGPAIPFVLYNNLTNFSTVSDITRATLARSAIVSGLNNPFGFGFGQASRGAIQHVDGRFQSWEIDGYLTGTTKDKTPPVYSWYARTIAELGPMGYGVIGSLIVATVYAAGRRVNSLPDLDPLFLAMILSLASFLAIGASQETYKYLNWWSFFIIAGSIRSEWRRAKEIPPA